MLLLLLRVDATCIPQDQCQCDLVYAQNLPKLCRCPLISISISWFQINHHRGWASQMDLLIFLHLSTIWGGLISTCAVVLRYSRGLCIRDYFKCVAAHFKYCLRNEKMRKRKSGQGEYVSTLLLYFLWLLHLSTCCLLPSRLPMHDMRSIWVLLLLSPKLKWVVMISYLHMWTHKFSDEC